MGFTNKFTTGGAHIVLLRIRCNTEKYMEKWDLTRKIYEFNNDSM